jgi:hypothetical protein
MKAMASMKESVSGESACAQHVESGYGAVAESSWRKKAAAKITKKLIWRGSANVNGMKSIWRLKAHNVAAMAAMAGG